MTQVALIINKNSGKIYRVLHIRSVTATIISVRIHEAIETVLTRQELRELYDYLWIQIGDFIFWAGAYFQVIDVSIASSDYEVSLKRYEPPHEVDSAFMRILISDAELMTI